MYAIFFQILIGDFTYQSIYSGNANDKITDFQQH